MLNLTSGNLLVTTYSANRLQYSRTYHHKKY